MRKNQGFVLIYVVGMVAFIAAALVLFQAESLSFTKRFSRLFKEVDSLYMAYSPIILSEKVIREDLKKGQQDGIGDNWYGFRKPRSFPVEGGEISFMMNDAGAMPDMNSLFTGKTKQDDAYMQVMQNYFSAYAIPQRFAGALLDWVDPNNKANRFGGVEYPAINDAVVANKNILSPGDIRLVHGYDEAAHKLLGNIVSYLPLDAPVNVNTVSPAFLEAVFKGKNARINYVTTQRERKIFVALGDFYEALNIDSPTKAVEFGSQTTYFTTLAQVNIQGVEKKIEALFERRRGKVMLRRLLWN
jgi:type II secretory pathway component PulK